MSNTSNIKYLIIHSPRGFTEIIYNNVWGDFARLLVAQFTINEEIIYECPLISVNVNLR